MSGNSRKRSRPSTEDANNSFVQSVTSKVTGLLPATISKWFSSSAQSSSNGSAPTAEVTDSSSDEEPDIPSPITQPPQKRTRYSSSNHYNASETNCVTYSNESPEPSSFNAGPSPLQKFTRDPNMVSTPFRPPNEDPSADRSERDSTLSKSSFSYSTLGPPVLNKRKSLFKSSTGNDETKSVKPSNNTIVDPKQPCFKPSLLVSPFYPSRTTYGGASSQYINRPNIKQTKGTYVNELNSNENTTMSQSARRIMDLLEDYSSPIMEAKRIPQYTRPRIDTSASTSQSNNNKSLSYKTSEFHAPNIASILRLKQKSRLMNTTNAARQIIASHSSASQYAPYSVNPIHRRLRTQSIGTNTEDPPRSESSQENVSKPETAPTLPPVSVPSAVLQISKDNLPKFTFGTNLPNPGASSTPKLNPSTKLDMITPKVSEPSSNPARAKKIIIVVSNTETNTSKSSAESCSSFTFSRPINVPLATGSPQVAIKPHKYIFANPDSGPIANNTKTNSLTVVGEKKDIEISEIAKPKDWKCSDCWVGNKPDADKCVCCGGKKPSAEGDKPVKCSVCKLANRQSHIDKCVNCEKVPTSSSFNSMPLVNSVKSPKWKCSDCWVENDDSQDNCVCCGGKNPKNSAKSAPIVLVKAATDNDWTCDDCWIKNKSSVDKCVACGGAKSGSKQNTASAMPTSIASSNMFKPVDNSLAPLMASQNNKWECTSCLVRNDNDKEKCVCCEMERPGAEKKLSKPTFNFGTATNTFKFGIDPKVQEAKLAKPPEIKPLEKKVEESEKNNNILSKAPPSFSFGIPAKKPEDQVDTVKNKPPVFATATTSDSTLGVQAAKFTMPEFTFKKPDNKDDNEKPQEVPKVDFSLPTPASIQESKPFGNILNASPSTSTPSTAAQSPVPSVATSLLNPVSSVEKKDTSSTQLPFQLGSATTSATSPTQNKFMFSGGLKPAMKLFGKPSSPPSTGIAFAAPAQSAPTTTAASLFQKPAEATSTPTMSLFQKNETSGNSPLSLFQKPSSAASTAAPSLASTAPVFSFGSATKPASTFNFGASQSTNMNDSTANNSFKFFGSTPDKNANTNKFNLGGVTNLGGNNSLTPGNILGSGNGLSSGNTLGSNLAGTNSITSGNPEMPGNQNDLQSGSSIQSPAPSIFGAPPQKENMWSQSSNTSNNLFGANNSANSLPKPGAFTFGASSPAFGAQSSNPPGSNTAFGSQPSNPSGANTAFGAQPNNPAASTTAFGAQPGNPSATSTAFGAQPSNPAASSTPFNAQTSNPATVFGSNAQPAPNLFGMGNQNQNNTRSLFASPVQNQPAPSLFGGSQPASTPAPAMGMFGSSAVGTNNTFGSPNQSLPSFDSSALTSAPAPAFNFGAQPSQSPVVFGFGQQPQAQQQQPQQPIYNFGGAGNSPQLSMGAAPQVQFSMGSAPAMRRMRKAVRRNPQR